MQEEPDFLKSHRCLHLESALRPQVDSHAERLVTVHQNGETGDADSHQVPRRPEREAPERGELSTFRVYVKSQGAVVDSEVSKITCDDHSAKKKIEDDEAPLSLPIRPSPAPLSGHRGTWCESASSVSPF